jgi:transposase
MGTATFAAVIDGVGRQLDDREFPASPAGYGALLEWLRGYGELDRVGVEGTGTYGVGLTRHLREAGALVVEVDRPDRRARRAQGKSDPTRCLFRCSSRTVRRCLGRAEAP